MTAPNVTTVNAGITDGGNIIIFYPMNQSNIAVFKLNRMIRDYMIEAEYANDICKACRKYLKSVFNGVELSGRTGGLNSKLIRCIPKGSVGFQLVLAKEEVLLGFYKKHENATFLQDACFNVDILKAAEKYLKRIEKHHLEEQRRLEI